MSALFLSKRDSAIWSTLLNVHEFQVLLYHKSSIRCCIWSLELALPRLDPLGKDSKAFWVASISILRDGILGVPLEKLTTYDISQLRKYEVRSFSIIVLLVYKLL